MLRLLVVVLTLVLLGQLHAEEPELKTDRTPTTIIPDQVASESLEKLAKHEQLLLETRITLDIHEMPLEKFAEVMSNELEVPVVIDLASLKDMGLSEDLPISLRVQGVAAKTTFKLAFHPNELALIVLPDGLLIVTIDEADSKLIRHIYDVSDLIDGKIVRPDDLHKLITEVVEPESWEELGGPGSISLWESKFIILNTWEAHQKVGQFLETLRHVKNQPSDSYAVSPRACTRWREEQIVIEQQLHNVEVANDFSDTPLEEVAHTLSEQGGFPIWIDNRALEDYGLTADAPISLPKRNRTLRHTLNLICESFELEWFIDGEVLRITTPDEVESELTITIYPVRDLMWKGPKPRDPAIQTRLLQLARWQTIAPYHAPELKPLCLGDYPALPGCHQLMSIIVKCVEFDSWEELGGPGCCLTYQLGDCLVILQKRPVHERVNILLQELRKHPPMHELARQLEQANQAEAEVITVSYPGPREMQDNQRKPGEPILSPAEMEKIAKLITSRIEPESWTMPGRYITVSQNCLVIRNRRDVMFQVHDRLVELGVTVPLKPGLDEEALGRMGFGNGFF